MSIALLLHEAASRRPDQPSEKPNPQSATLTLSPHCPRNSKQQSAKCEIAREKTA